MKIIHAKKLVSRIISVPPSHREAASATEERRDSTMAIMAHSASIVPKSVGAALQPLPQLACIVWRGVGRTTLCTMAIMAHSASIVPKSAAPTLIQLTCIVWRGVGRTECSPALVWWDMNSIISHANLRVHTSRSRSFFFSSSVFEKF